MKRLLTLVTILFLSLFFLNSTQAIVDQDGGGPTYSLQYTNTSNEIIAGEVGESSYTFVQTKVLHGTSTRIYYEDSRCVDGSTIKQDPDAPKSTTGCHLDIEKIVTELSGGNGEQIDYWLRNWGEDSDGDDIIVSRYEVNVAPYSADESATGGLITTNPSTSSTEGGTGATSSSDGSTYVGYEGSNHDDLEDPIFGTTFNAEECSSYECWIERVWNWALIILIPLSVLILTGAGVLYMLSEGDSNRVALAKQLIIGVASGIAVLILGRVLLFIILGEGGVNEWWNV